MKYSANSVWVNKDKYDVVVIGAGHAGCEAALATARLGLKTIVFTVSIESFRALRSLAATWMRIQRRVWHRVSALLRF